VGAAVLAAAAGALTVTLVVAVTTDSTPLPGDAGVPDRTAERPSRAQARGAEPTGGLVERLLPAAALASPTSGRPWRVVHTELHEPRALAGSCHRFPLVSVGAIRVAHRAYTLGRPASAQATAEHVVARFADPRTAWRAHEVLLAWHADCRASLAGTERLRVSPPHDLDGGGQHYAVAWAPGAADDRVREDVALARVGSRVALLRVTAAPADAGTGRDVVVDAMGPARALLD